MPWGDHYKYDDYELMSKKHKRWDGTEASCVTLWWLWCGVDDAGTRVCHNQILDRWCLSVGQIKFVEGCDCQVSKQQIHSLGSKSVVLG